MIYDGVQHENYLTKEEENKMDMELLVLKIKDVHIKGEVSFDYIHSAQQEDSFYIRPVPEQESIGSLGYKYCVVHINPEYTYESYFGDISGAVQFIHEECLKREKAKRK